MRMTFFPGKPLRGTVTLPGDKSISHRAALFSALAKGESQIDNFLIAGVTRVMLSALSNLGIRWGLSNSLLCVEGEGLQGFRKPDLPIHCGNSATTVRLLAGALAASGIPSILDGSPGLRRRPMKRIVAPLQKMGVDIQATEGQYAPLSIWQRETSSSTYTPQIQSSTIALKVASAQVKSCLLLAALAANGPVTVTEPGPSRDHTERMLASMGISIDRVRLSDTQYRTTLIPPQNTPLEPLSLTIPGDISSAAFLIIAALITPGSEITIQDVGLNPTRTGLLDTLVQMGARIETINIKERHGEPLGDLIVQHSSMHGTEVKGTEVVRMIDEFPAFAIAAAFAHGPTKVRDAQELRYKETDRIKSLCEQLHNVGVEIQEQPDGFSLPGNTPPQGGAIDPCGDHRLAMSLAIAGLASGAPIDIQDAAIIQESFPNFRETLENLGAHIE